MNQKGQVVDQVPLIPHSQDSVYQFSLRRKVVRFEQIKLLLLSGKLPLNNTFRKTPVEKKKGVLMLRSIKENREKAF